MAKHRADAVDDGLNGGGLQVVERAFKLIFVLKEYDRKVSLQELAAELQCSKSAVHRLLSTLEGLDLVVRDRLSGQYQFGRKLQELSADAWTRADARTVALPHMERLRDQTGETVSLHARDGVMHVVVEECESRHDVQWVMRVGRRYPLLRGAAARAILAFLAPDEARTILDQIRTEENPGPPDALLRRARKAGFAMSVKGLAADGMAIAAPIFNRQGRVYGALCVSGPLTRFTAAKANDLAGSLLRAAAAISDELGYRSIHSSTTPISSR
jgi:IclR family transcriptional regulator, KDG regulon repressor